MATFVFTPRPHDMRDYCFYQFQVFTSTAAWVESREGDKCVCVSECVYWLHSSLAMNRQDGLANELVDTLCNPLYAGGRLRCSQQPYTTVAYWLGRELPMASQVARLGGRQSWPVAGVD